jgi:hypothetical protein
MNQALFSNNAASTLQYPLSPTTTTITLAVGGGELFPSPVAPQFFPVTLTDALTQTVREICYCTARSGDVLTVSRAQETTDAAPWLAGDLVLNLVTAAVLESYSAQAATAIDITAPPYNAVPGTDITAIIAAVEAAALPGQPVLMPGTFYFNEPLTSLRQGFCWQGLAPGLPTLIYQGVSTTIDLITVGDGVTAIIRPSFKSFMLQSATKMTAGAGLHLKGWVRGNVDVVLQGQDAAQGSFGNNLWDGLWCDQLDDIQISNDTRIFAQNRGAMANGGALGATGWTWLAGKVGLCAKGIVLGGGTGGTVLGAVNSIENGNNLVIDQSLYSVRNREVFLTTYVSDVTTVGAGIVVNDPGGPFIYFTAGWCCSAATQGLHVQVCTNGQVMVVATQFFNNGYNNGGAPSTQGDGIRVDDATCLVDLGSCPMFGNYGWDINPNAAGHKVSWAPSFLDGGGLGTVNPANPPTRSPPPAGSALQLQTYLLTTPMTFAALEAVLPSPVAGMRACINDSLVAMVGNYGQAISVGGGSHTVPVSYSDGSWRVGS